MDPVNRENLLDEGVPEIDVPILRPTTYVRPLTNPKSLKYLAKEAFSSINKKIGDFANWIVSYVPKPVERVVSKRVATLKKEVKTIFDRLTRSRVSLREKEAPIKGFLKTYRVDGMKGYDQRAFVDHVRSRIIELLSKKKKPFQVKFVLSCKFRKGKEYNFGYFPSDVRRVLSNTDLGEIYNASTEMFLERVSKFQNKGSGWHFVEVEYLDVNVDPFKPLRGSSYFPLPRELDAKKAIIIVKNINDNECFKWAVTSAVYPRKVHPERLNAEMRKNSEKLDWTGIDFPTPLNQIERFEKRNSYSINVFGWDGKGVYPLRISKHENEQHISLLLLANGDNQHYCWIKNESALVASQVGKHEKKVYLCKYCCNARPSMKSLQEHQEYCSRHEPVKVVMPSEGAILTFKNHCRKMQVPFVIYADFEAITENISTCSPNNEDSYTKPYQRHTPCGFSYLIKCFDDELFPPKQVSYTSKGLGESVGKVFVEYLESDIAKIYGKFKFKRNKRITKEEEGDFERALVCHICEGQLDGDRVRDHCHLTGRYRGAAHNKCNLDYKLPKFYPVIFHNLSGYDTHMFIKDLAETDGEISCIAKTEENYVSFTKTIVVDTFEKEGKQVDVKRDIRFIDSFRFMSSSLAELASNLTIHENLEMFFEGRKCELLKRKGVYPYDYMDTLERLDETSLPPIEQFHSN